MTNDGPPQTPPSPPEWDEIRRWIHEQRRSAVERAYDKQDEQFNAMNMETIKSSSAVLKTVLLINGGAVVALLSFIGHLDPTKMKAVAGTLTWFGWGVVASVVALTLSYFTHYSMAGHLAAHRRNEAEFPFVFPPATKKWIRLKGLFHFLAATTVLAAIVLFIIGMFRVRDAFLH